MGLSKEEFLTEAKSSFKTEQVEVSAGKFITVSEIDATDYVKMTTEHTQDGKMNLATFVISLVAASVVDNNGARMFTDEEFKNTRIPKSIVDKIAAAAKRVNGIEGGEKNDSSETPQDSSDGGSQLPLDLDTLTNS